MFPCEQKFDYSRGRSRVRKSGGCSDYQTEYNNNFNLQELGCAEGPIDDNPFLQYCQQCGLPLTPYYSQSCLPNIGKDQQNGPTVYIEPYWTSFCTTYCPQENQCAKQNCAGSPCCPNYPPLMCPKCHQPNCPQQNTEMFPRSVWVNYTINPYAGCISVENTCPSPPTDSCEVQDNAVKSAEDAFWEKYYKQVCESTKPKADQSGQENEAEDAKGKKAVPPLESKAYKHDFKKGKKTKSKGGGDKQCKSTKTGAGQAKKRRSKSTPPPKTSYTSALPFRESYRKNTDAQCIPCPPPEGYPCQTCQPTNTNCTCPLAKACRFNGIDESTCDCYYGTEQFLSAPRLINEPFGRKVQFCSMPTRVPRATGGCGSCGNKGCLKNPLRNHQLKFSRSTTCNCTCYRSLL